MGRDNKKEKFQSKIPEEYQRLTMSNITKHTADKIIREFPEIRIPDFIDEEVEKGHISKDKADELKCKCVVNGIQKYIRKEKEDFYKANAKTKKNFIGKIKPEPRRVMVSVYESECNGVISKNEVDYLIDALK